MRRGAHPDGRCLHQRAAEREPVRRPNGIDWTGNSKIWERRLADRSKPTTSILIPPVDFIEEHITSTVLVLVDGIGIARQTTLVDCIIEKSIKPAELWNGES